MEDPESRYGGLSSLRSCQELFTDLPEAVVLLDKTGTITKVNLAAQRLLGLSSRDLLGMRHDNADIWEARGWSLHEPDSEGDEHHGAQRLVADALSSGESVSGHRLVLDRPISGKTYLSLDVVPLRTELGALTGVGLIYHDVTEQEARRTEGDWLRRDLMATRRELEGLLDLSDALNTINDTIHSTLDFEEVLKRLLGEAVTALGADLGAITLRETTGWMVRAVNGLPEELTGTRLSDRKAAHAFLVSDGQPLMLADATIDERLSEDFLYRHGARSLLSVPLIARGEVVGSLSFCRLEPLPFVQSEHSFASKVAATASLALDNARAYQEERHIADTLQRTLLVIPEAMAGLEFKHLYQSATEAAWVGGDFFDLFELAEQRVGILIGDVSGKGVEASALASFTRQLIKAQAQEGLTPAEVMTETNGLVYRISHVDDFVTVFFGVLAMDSGEFDYCNAGHPPPILVHDGCGASLEGGGAIVGAWEGLCYENMTVRLEGGDLLVLYTDGVIEAKRDGDLFGEGRLVKAVEALDDSPLENMPRTILDEVSEFAKGRLRDDVAMLFVTPKA